eukprot:Lithocolla_globosa_v1_NODE_332_length_4428_cov_206.625429.p3 type:complete len:136 gc:universal NODE_332_length_4428_cov_206.625429:2473-2066(-)
MQTSARGDSTASVSTTKKDPKQQRSLTVTPSWDPVLLRRKTSRFNAFTAKCYVAAARWRWGSAISSSTAGSTANSFLDEIIVNQPSSESTGKAADQPYHMPKDRTNSTHDRSLDYIYTSNLKSHHRLLKSRGKMA